MGDQSLGDSSHPKLTFAELVMGKNKKNHVSTAIDISSLTNPTMKDGKPAIVIPQDYYEEGCQIRRFSLIGRLDLKGVKLNDIKVNLEQQWSLGETRVQFIPMNRGFFIIKLLSQEDKDKVYREGNKDPWIVNEQPLRLIDWYPGFDADKQCTSHSTIWVKFPGLPVEMWVEKTLLSLGKSLGTPIMVDKRTLNHEYGHFASVLIDIDFSKLNSDSVHVEAGGRNFLQPFEILKRPKYCSKCKIVGHQDSECRKKHTPLNSEVQHPVSTNVASNKKNGKRNRKGPAQNLQPTTVSVNGTVELEQQIQDDLAISEAVLRSATAEFEKSKQAAHAHTVLVKKAKSVSTSVLNTKPGGNVELARTKLPNPGRIPISSLPTLVCDALEQHSEYVSHNKFNILGTNFVGESSNSQLHDINRIDEAARRAKQQQLLALQARIDALRDNDNMSDLEEESELGIRARNGSSPRLKASSNTASTVNLSKTQNPRV
ncbi:uncharacterized protein LOC113360465 [Papaver somniferum]|uniref:uncharacterized protein LOC113360465 n=1 Tax=Papaver somniferum TaxID=3469 RepID=UPI000E701D17|nr:uncharacterized protein LOC113360465 [Papaver somniferum]